MTTAFAEPVRLLEAHELRHTVNTEDPKVKSIDYLGFKIPDYHGWKEHAKVAVEAHLGVEKATSLLREGTPLTMEHYMVTITEFPMGPFDGKVIVIYTLPRGFLSQPKYLGMVEVDEDSHTVYMDMK